MDYRKLDLQKKAEQLEMQETMLDKTESFIVPQLMLRISEFTFLQEQLMNKWDEEKFSRLEQLQQEIKNLNNKIEYEKKEIVKHKKQYEDFQKLQQKMKLIEFKKSLNKINKKFN